MWSDAFWPFLHGFRAFDIEFCSRISPWEFYVRKIFAVQASLLYLFEPLALISKSIFIWSREAPEMLELPEEPWFNLFNSGFYSCTPQKLNLTLPFIGSLSSMSQYAKYILKQNLFEKFYTIHRVLKKWPKSRALSRHRDRIAISVPFPRNYSGLKKLFRKFWKYFIIIYGSYIIIFILWIKIFWLFKKVILKKKPKILSFFPDFCPEIDFEFYFQLRCTSSYNK